MPRILKLANAYLSTQSLPKVAQRRMELLARECQQTVSLDVLDGADVVYVEIEHAQTELGIQGDVGGRHPVHATALGKVLLAGLAPQEAAERLKGRDLVRMTQRTLVDPQEIVAVVNLVRLQGFAIDDEERGIGIRCVAVPIYDHRGDVVTAKSVAGASFHMTDENLITIRRRLVKAVMEVSYELGYTPLVSS